MKSIAELIEKNEKEIAINAEKVETAKSELAELKKEIERLTKMAMNKGAEIARYETYIRTAKDYIENLKDEL